MGSYAFFSAIALIVSSAERKHDIAQLPKATKKSKIANRTKRNMQLEFMLSEDKERWGSEAGK